MINRRTLIQSLAVAPIAGSLLLRSTGVSADASPVRVASKDFPENIAIGEMYALLLEHAGMKVERNLNLGGTAIAQAALVSNKIDLYPEYTGTGLLVVLKKTLADVPGLAKSSSAATPESASATPVASSAADLVAVYVAGEYKRQFQLIWLKQDQMNDSQALAVTKDFATKNSLTTISQLVAFSSKTGITISAPVDFEDRADGLKGLKQTYGNFNAKVNGVAPGLKYQSFLDGDANVVLAFSTDAEIKIHDLVVLQDDKGLWPPYYVAPVVRNETLTANPKLEDALNALAPILTTEEMIGLNGQMVGDQKKDPKDVAKAFLLAKGLIS